MPVKVSRKSLKQDAVSLTGSDSLEVALGQTPLVRAEKVAAGKRLVMDTSYPPTVLIRKIAALLAVHLDQSGLSNNDSQ